MWRRRRRRRRRNMFGVFGFWVESRSRRQTTAPNLTIRVLAKFRFAPRWHELVSERGWLMAFRMLNWFVPISERWVMCVWPSWTRGFCIIFFRQKFSLKHDCYLEACMYRESWAISTSGDSRGSLVCPIWSLFKSSVTHFRKQIYCPFEKRDPFHTVKLVLNPLPQPGQPFIFLILMTEKLGLLVVCGGQLNFLRLATTGRKAGGGNRWKLIFLPVLGW